MGRRYVTESGWSTGAGPPPNHWDGRAVNVAPLAVTLWLLRSWPLPSAPFRSSSAMRLPPIPITACNSRATWCASCHLAQFGGIASDAAPTFAAIAHNPATT